MPLITLKYLLGNEPLLGSFTILYNYANISLMNQTTCPSQLIYECFQLLEDLLYLEKASLSQSAISGSKTLPEEPEK